MAWMELEREWLAETARATDPNNPTLCEGWNAHHLMAHLVLREQHPLRFGIDIALHRKPGHEVFLQRLVAKTSTSDGYRELIDRFAAGPPKWSPLTWAGDRAHLVEYVIHHEDLRRVRETQIPAPNRSAEHTTAIWDRLSGIARVALGRSPVGVALEAPGYPRHLVRKQSPAVRVCGDPIEVALFVLGRRGIAEVDFEGAPEACSTFRNWAGV